MADERDNPYVGLRPFGTDDSLYFFGRREQTTALLEILHATRFLPVVGSSGSGKSSLVLAGLIPALRGGFLVDERDAWRIATMRPGEAPIDNLSRALVKAFARTDAPVAPDDDDELSATLRSRHTDGLVDWIRAQVMPNENLLIIADQFEEIFRFRRPDDDETVDAERRGENARRREEAADFVDLLMSIAGHTELPVYVVLTMRTDFLGDCDLFYGLPERMNASQYLVPRMTREQLRQAVSGPVQLMRAKISPRLLDKILNDLGDRQDRLPVLQHALLRTWDAWVATGQVGPVDTQHLESAGGLDGALAKDAQEVLFEFAGGDIALDVIFRILRALVDTDVRGRRVRRPTTVGELVNVAGAPIEVIEHIIARFSGNDRNFLYQTQDGLSGNPRVDISHESLIRQWDTLRELVDDERKIRDYYLQLVKYGREWEKGEKELLSRSDLELARHWRLVNEPTPEWAERYEKMEGDYALAMDYVAASERAEADAIAEAARRRRQRRITVTATVAILALLSAKSWWDSRRAQRATEQAVDLAAYSLAQARESKTPTIAAALASQFVLTSEFDIERVDLLRRIAGRKLAYAQFDSAGTIAMSNSGTRIAIGRPDSTIVVMQVENRADSIVVRSPDVPTGLDFSLDENHLVTSFRNGAIRVVTLANPGDVKEWKPDTQPVLWATLSERNTWLLGKTESGTIRIWEHAKPGGEPVLSRENVRVAFFSAGDDRVLFMTNEGEINLISLPDARVLMRARVPRAEWLRTDSADAVIAVTTDSSVVILDGRTGKSRRRFAILDVQHAVPSKHGTHLAIVGRDPTITILELATGRVAGTLTGHTAPVADLVFLGDSSEHVATASWDNSIRVWHRNGLGKPTVLNGHATGVYLLSASVKSDRLLSQAIDNTALVWKAPFLSQTGSVAAEKDTAQLILGYPDREEPRVRGLLRSGTSRAVMSPNGKSSFFVHGKLGVVVSEGKAAQAFTEHVESQCLQFSPDGSRLLSCYGVMAALTRGDTVTPMTRPGGEPIIAQHGLFTPDGSRILTSGSGIVHAWDGMTGAHLSEFSVGKGKYLSAISPDGTMLMFLTDTNVAIVRRTDGTGEPVTLVSAGALHGGVFSPDGGFIVLYGDPGGVFTTAGAGLWAPSEGISSASFAYDSKRVAVGLYNNIIRLADLQTGALDREYKGLGNTPTAVTFSPGDSLIAASSHDWTARIWKTQSDGTQSLLLAGHDSAVMDIKFTSGSDAVTTISTDGTTRTWTINAAVLQESLRDATTVCVKASFRESNFREPPKRARAKELECLRQPSRKRVGG